LVRQLTEEDELLNPPANLRGGFFACMGAPKGKAERSDLDAVDLLLGKRRHASHKASAPSQ
jgi:hypothetical protein